MLYYLRQVPLLAMTVTTLLLAACQDNALIRYPQSIDRADLGTLALPNEPAPLPPFHGSGLTQLPPPAAVEQTMGTYDFVVPPTVTQVKRTTNDFEQYSLYMGRPAPTDTPFLVITVGPRVQLESQQPETKLAAENVRRYSLNGLIATEWTGHTTDHRLPFCEILAAHGSTGDQLAAVAVARNDEQRKAALDILASITWRPLK